MKQVDGDWKGKEAETKTPSRKGHDAKAAVYLECSYMTGRKEEEAGEKSGNRSQGPGLPSDASSRVLLDPT